MQNYILLHYYFSLHRFRLKPILLSIAELVGIITVYLLIFGDIYGIANDSNPGRIGVIINGTLSTLIHLAREKYETVIFLYVTVISSYAVIKTMCQHPEGYNY